MVYRFAGAAVCTAFLDSKNLVKIYLLFFIFNFLDRAFSVTSLIADVFILLGLGYVFYYDIALLSTRGVASEIVMFNLKDFPLFVGTALFSFEGICLILPIQGISFLLSALTFFFVIESMKRPEKFNKTLSICILIIGIVFLCIGSLGYLTFGKDVATVNIINMYIFKIILFRLPF